MKLSSSTKMLLRKSPLLPMLYSNIILNTSLEHIIPVSYMKNHIHARDIHNIYSTTEKMNQLRSNYTYNYLANVGINYENNLICKIHSPKFFEIFLQRYNNLFRNNRFSNIGIFKCFN